MTSGKAIAEGYWALRGTREGRYNFLPVGFITKLIESSCGIPSLHALKVHPRSDSCSGLDELVVDGDGTFEEGPVRIMDS